MPDARAVGTVVVGETTEQLQPRVDLPTPAHREESTVATATAGEEEASGPIRTAGVIASSSVHSAGQAGVHIATEAGGVAARRSERIASFRTGGLTSQVVYLQPSQIDLLKHLEVIETALHFLVAPADPPLPMEPRCPMLFN
jgi:hypothetical protein